ncbi:MAG: MarR family transcriptional regulator [Deltaproteobacteria bacterium]|nr:MarR family transcriptional regulator [Deltaproteobacteria bacterium]
MDVLRLDNQLCFPIYAAAHAIGRAYAPMLDELGLTYPQYLVMLVLWEKDGVGLNDIGARLHLDSGTLTPLLKRLEAQGLVERTRSTEDERRIVVALTAEGKKLRQAAVKIPLKLGAKMARALPKMYAMRGALRDLVKILGSGGDDR